MLELGLQISVQHLFHELQYVALNYEVEVPKSLLALVRWSYVFGSTFKFFLPSLSFLVRLSFGVSLNMKKDVKNKKNEKKRLSS